MAHVVTTNIAVHGAFRTACPVESNPHEGKGPHMPRVERDPEHACVFNLIAALKSLRSDGPMLKSQRVDDEHRLIARYAAKLAADANSAAISSKEVDGALDSNRIQRQLVAQLEAKNREIINEIQRLRLEQERHAKLAPEEKGHSNPTLLAELRVLRARRDELEARMSALQESRRDLMVQLENLMKLLKQGSSGSTPNVQQSRTSQSPPLTPHHQRNSSVTPLSQPTDSLTGLGGDVRLAFVQIPGPGNNGTVSSLRNELLVAADSVTSAMSSLVTQLNATSDSEQSDMWSNELQRRLAVESDFLQQLHSRRPSQFDPSTDLYNMMNTQAAREHSEKGTVPVLGENEPCFRSDINDYENVSDLRVRYDKVDANLRKNFSSSSSHPSACAESYKHYQTGRDKLSRGEDVCLETDRESYIPSEEEDNSTNEWEESMKRWVNR